MASTSTQDLTDVALEAPPTTTSNIASLEANVAPTLSGPESKQSTSDTSSTSTNSIATLVDPVTGAIVEPAELEGMEGWIRYEETNDYKLHSTWETAKTRGFKGKCKWAAYKMADGADAVGGWFANLFGITDSRYQWVLDAAERMEYEAKQQRDEEVKRLAYLEKLENEKIRDMEGGQPGDEEKQGQDKATNTQKSGVKSPTPSTLAQPPSTLPPPTRSDLAAPPVSV